VRYRKNDVAIIGEVWLKSRCIALSYWAINTVLRILIVKSTRFMHVWQS